ncbi:hypothetical protein BSLG_005886 [Batrachochytrium salamandrivorans]|nr:hypothetical protein BSLG_005886 [Batrachochytrium salamandrivorans]
MASTAPSRGRMKRVPVKRSVDENDSTTDDMTIEKESSNSDLKELAKNLITIFPWMTFTRHWLSEMEPSQQHQITDNDAWEQSNEWNWSIPTPFLSTGIARLKINFIVGHNGSGKSAILTALSLSWCVASVTVKIRNKGPDAYKASVYGDSITVERKIVRDGQNSYKIRDVHGHTVSTSHEISCLLMITCRLLLIIPWLFSPGYCAYVSANSSSHDKYLVQAVPEMKEDVETSRDNCAEIDEAAKIEEEFHQYNAEYIWSKIEEQEQNSRSSQLVEQEQQKLAIVEPKIIQCEVDLSTAQTNAQTLSTQLSDALW